MTTLVWRLVVVVSCAHALVHVFELALPSVEQLVARDYQVGKGTTGLLATSFRLPFGGFAILAGWLVDRFGAPRMISVYLFGCALAALLISAAGNLGVLFVAMFAMGMFASIFHPAGLALISIATPTADRPRALGIFGIFGSAGIGSAPFLAAAVLDAGSGWRDYYAVLTIPAVILGIRFFLLSAKSHGRSMGEQNHNEDSPEYARWKSFLLVTVFATMSGFVYAAFLTFLPRYLGEAGTHLFSSQPEAERNYLAGIVLLCGMFGQYLGGRFARPGRLEGTLAAIALGSAPFLAAMAWATGPARFWMATGFALVHFMTQPVYNSLIAEYVPQRRRSLGYGFSFSMAFGIGSFGSTFAGSADRWAGADYGDAVTYGGLTVMALAAGTTAVLLWIWNRPGSERDGLPS